MALKHTPSDVTYYILLVTGDISVGPEKVSAVVANTRNELDMLADSASVEYLGRLQGLCTVQVVFGKNRTFTEEVLQVYRGNPDFFHRVIEWRKNNTVNHPGMRGNAFDAERKPVVADLLHHLGNSNPLS